MARWVVLYFLEEGDRTHVPSLIAAAVLVLVGVQIWTLGFVAGSHCCEPPLARGHPASRAPLRI